MIRKARTPDAVEAFDIYFHPGVHPFMHYEKMPRAGFRETWKRLLKAKNVFVAVEEKELLGFVACRQGDGRMSHVVDVSMLAVKPDLQGKGIGKKLMAFAGKWARERKATRLQLFVEADNPGAKTFYEKLGYRGEGLLENYIRRKKGGYVDDYLMAKLL